MKKLILILSIVSMYLSCEKEDVKDDFDLAVEKVNLDCTDNKDSIFFQANINNKNYCMSFDKFPARPLGVVDSAFNNFIIRFYSTRGDSSYKPIFIIQSPSLKTKASEVMICDEFLRKGVIFPLSALNDTLTNKFKITLEIYVWDKTPSLGSFNSGSSYNANTNSGNQLTNANILFDDVVRTEKLSQVTYDVKGHFNCKLYKEGLKGALVWDVQNAQFKFSIDAKK
jgi:hypothetical protein